MAILPGAGAGLIPELEVTSFQSTFVSALMLQSVWEGGCAPTAAAFCL